MSRSHAPRRNPPRTLSVCGRSQLVLGREARFAGETVFTQIAMDTASPYTDHLAPGTVAIYERAYRGIREPDVGAQSIAETVTVGG